MRLARSCEEILTTGKLIVRRPDAEELLYIRNGGWSYEKLVEYADGIEATLERLVKESPLPQTPDTEELDRLCQDMVEYLYL